MLVTWPPANPLTYQKNTYKVHRVHSSRVIDSLAACLLYFEFVHYIKGEISQLFRKLEYSIKKAKVNLKVVLKP